MANKFDKGETIICECDVKDSAGAWKNPSTSMNVEIKQINPAYEVVVAATAMTLETNSTGQYYYDCSSTGLACGTYQVNYIATDGTRITIGQETFNLME